MPSSWQCYQTDQFTYGGLAFMPFCRPPSRYTWSVHMLLQCYVLLIQVCNIAKGQRYSSKLNEHQVRNILRLACVRPAEREERTLGVNTITNPTCVTAPFIFCSICFFLFTLLVLFSKVINTFCAFSDTQEEQLYLWWLCKRIWHQGEQPTCFGWCSCASGTKGKCIFFLLE